MARQVREAAIGPRRGEGVSFEGVEIAPSAVVDRFFAPAGRGAGPARPPVTGILAF